MADHFAYRGKTSKGMSENALTIEIQEKLKKENILEGLKLIDRRYYFGMLQGKTESEEYKMRNALIEAIRLLENINKDKEC
jgi:hypothetical protein